MPDMEIQLKALPFVFFGPLCI